MNGLNTLSLPKLGLALVVMIAAYFASPAVGQAVLNILTMDRFYLIGGAALTALVIWSAYRFKWSTMVMNQVTAVLGLVGGPALVGFICAGMHSMHAGLFETTIYPQLDPWIKGLPAQLAAQQGLTWISAAVYAVLGLVAFRILLGITAKRFGRGLPQWDSEESFLANIRKFATAAVQDLPLVILVATAGAVVVAIAVPAVAPTVITFIGTILPAIHIAIEGAMFAVPVFLYYKVITRPAGGKAYFRWFWRIARPHWLGEKWLTTWFYFIIVVAFIALVAQLNSWLQDAMINLKNALVAKDQAKYDQAFWFAISVFIFATFFMPFNIWIRAKAFMHWRKDLTKYVLKKYLAIDRKYYSIAGHEEIDNPDERIHEDINEFTTRTYSLVLTLADVVSTLALFTFKLWALSPILGYASIAYALAGTVAMLFFANKMVAFMVNEKRTEANFRYYLIFVRILAESIAFFRGERKELAEVERRFAKIVDNYNRLIAWTRNQNFVLKFYGYMDYFVVLMIVAPLYFAGKVEYGAIDGAQMAFGMVLGSLSIFVSEFVTLSKLAATTERLGKFMDALDEPDTQPGEAAYAVEEDANRHDIELKDVTIITPRHPRLLIKDLDLTIAPGKSVIFVGPSGSGKTSAFRVISGLWKKGTGTIKRPPLSDFMFLPQKPYMSVGTLRDQILYPNIEKMRLPAEEVAKIVDERRASLTDEELIAILASVGLTKFVERYPQGLDTVSEHQSWGDVLSPGEQLRISFARVVVSKPKIVFLDEATAALDTKNERRLYTTLKDLGVTFASVGHRPSLVNFHDQVVELAGDETGGWTVMTPTEYVEKQRKEAGEENKDK